MMHCHGSFKRNRVGTYRVVGSWTLICAVGIGVSLIQGFRGAACGAEGEQDRRVPWTTSRFFGSPDPPLPYGVQLAFPKLKFQRPLVITNAPASDRLFVAQQSGRIYSFVNSRECEDADLFVDLKRARPTLSAVYGLAFHPNFAKNRFVYVCYVVSDKPLKDGTRVSRFTVHPGDPPRIDIDSERLIITWRGGGHNGGCLKFGADGYLYISTGDAAPPTPPDPLNAGQDVSNLLSAILRIDIDHVPTGSSYGIPTDNPFVDLPGARGEIWSYGFRNPWKMSFDRATGDLWVGDVGWELWEMIYRVQKGGNYGWSIMEGRQPVRPEDSPGPTPILPPTVDHPHSEAASITGGFVYRGDRLKTLRGAYIYGDYQSGIVWGLRMDGDRVRWHKELARTPLQLVGFGEDNAGELYLLDYRQQIFELVENTESDTSRDFPQTLSETGLFTSVQDESPAPGVLPYRINAEMWADHTRTDRWMAVPSSASIRTDDHGRWQFPDGSVLAKTIRLEMKAGDPLSDRRLETQILHREADRWRPYTYIWNDQQTDANLAPAAGRDQTFRVTDAAEPGGVRKHEHRFFGRTQCVLCHNPWIEASTMFGLQSASPLAIRTAQLDARQVGGKSESDATQLDVFRRIGLLVAGQRRSVERPLVDPYDESAGLDERARAYLDVNCSHCHQFNAGGTATIRLSATTSLSDSKTIDERPTQGTFGISNAKIIAPGDPFGSVLYYRIAKLGGGRMPRIGSHEVDRRGCDLIYQWIEHLKTNASANDRQQEESIARLLDESSAVERSEAVAQSTQSTRGALALMRLLDTGQVDQTVRHEIISAARHGTAVEVQDLFERFVPPEQRTQRLGSTVDVTKLLAMEADARRGQQLLVGDSVACKNCHRIGDLGEVGQRLGPDLSQIGKKYDRRQLLQQILAPSNSIDPKYVPYVLETTFGQVFTGFIEARTPEEVVLRDADNQVHRIASDQIDRLVRQRKSLMPDLLLRDLTPQQVADLLGYLASLK